MAKRKKVKRKASRKAPIKRVARKKVTRKVTRKTRRKSTKKNPMKVDVVVRAKKGKKAGEVLYSESSGIMRTPSEIRKLELHIDKLRESKYRTKSRTAKKAIDKRIAEIKKDLVRDKSMRRAGLKQLSSTRKIRRDYAAAPRYSKEGVAEEIVVKRNTVIYPETRRKSKVARKRKTTKRKIVKRKTTKRKTTKKKVAKVTAEVRAGKTTTGGKIKAKRRLKKGQSISKVVSRKRRKYKMSLKRTNPKRRRRNPMALPMGMTMSAEGLKLKGVTLTGFEMSEIGELAAGGLLYGAINGALPKVPLLGQLQSLLMRVPVVGTSLTPFVLGMALNFISGKFLGRRGMGKMLEHLGDGLVAASVVGMGVNASQLVPFLTPGGTVSGVDYTPNYGALPQADFGKSADFGAIDYFPKYSGVDFTPDFSGVDYTPNFSGVDYTPDFSGPDFGADADFGETPEGLYGIPTGLN